MAVAGIGLVVLLTGCLPGYTLPWAGNGTTGTTGDAGPAINAELQVPGAVVAVPSGFFILDNASCEIRGVDATGTITRVAGITGSCGYTGDGGPATSANIQLSAICSCVEDVNGGAIYFVASGPSNGGGAIREIAPDGTISTVATPVHGLITGLTSAPEGTLYYLDATPNAGGEIFSIAADNTITPVYTIPASQPMDTLAFIDADTFAVSNYSDGAVGRLDVPSGTVTPTGFSTGVFAGGGLKAMADGTIYATTSGHQVVRIDPDNTVTTIAGNGSPDPGTGAQVGLATDLAFSPTGIAITPNNGLLLSSGHVVYRVDDPLHIT